MSTPAVDRTSGQGSPQRPFQFTTRSLLFFMLVLGLVCTLAPARLRSGAVSAVMQVLWALYLIIGFYQASLWASLVRQPNPEPALPNSVRSAERFVRFGCLTTLPMWVLVVIALFVRKWASVSVFEEATMFFGAWLVWAAIGQLVGCLVNLQTCLFLWLVLDPRSRRLALLNAANAPVFLLILCAGGLIELL